MKQNPFDTTVLTFLAKAWGSNLRTGIRDIIVLTVENQTFVLASQNDFSIRLFAQYRGLCWGNIEEKYSRLSITFRLPQGDTSTFVSNQNWTDLSTLFSDVKDRIELFESIQGSRLCFTIL